MSSEVVVVVVVVAGANTHVRILAGTVVRLCVGEGKGTVEMLVYRHACVGMCEDI